MREQDTDYGMRWIAFKDLIVQKGFEILSADEFTYQLAGETHRAENLVAAHRKKLLLHATSSERVVNGGSVYAYASKNGHSPEEWMHTVWPLPHDSIGPAVDDPIYLGLKLFPFLFSNISE